MNIRKRALRPLAAIAAVAAACGLAAFSGCAMSDDKDTSSGIDTLDLFPKPKGEALVPLDLSTVTSFRYAEFDTNGVRSRTFDLDLHVAQKSLYSYGYAYEAGKSGYLIERRTSLAKPDSDGIYIVGTFNESGLNRDSNAVLWLPDRPKVGTSWHLSANRVTEVVSVDTAIWTEPLFSSGSDTGAIVRHNLQRQPTVLFKETYFDTVTYYHFRRGVGCVAFQRNAKGVLLAIGSIFRIYGARVSGF